MAAPSPLASLAAAGDWRGVLARTAPPAASAPRAGGGGGDAAWRVVALVKTGQPAAAAAELDAMGDLDQVAGESGGEGEVSGGREGGGAANQTPAPAAGVPFALRWTAAVDLPARLGRPADEAVAAAASLLAFCDRRAEAAAAAAAADARRLWSDRAQACEWALARLHAPAAPATARAWARAALERRAAGGAGNGGCDARAPLASLLAPDWAPPPGLDPASLAAAARLEAALGDVAAAKRLFAAAAAAGAPPADAARGSCLLRFCAGDAARAAAGWGGLEGGAPVDAANEALARLHAGDSAAAAAASFAPYFNAHERGLPVDALAAGALRTAATLADLAPPPVARATRARLAAALTPAAGAPDDVDVSVVAPG